MFSCSFNIRVIIKVLLLSATWVLFAFIIFKKIFILLPVTVALFGIYQVFSLIHFTQKTNRDLSRFLLSIKYDDTSQAFTSEGLGESFSELKEAFREVMRKLQETRSEREVHARYLNTVIQHVGIGLIVYKSDGTVDLINKAAKKLLRITLLKNLNDMKESFPELVKVLLNLKEAEKKLIKLDRDGEIRHLSIFAHTFLMMENECTLVSIQNIQEELEEKEMEAWQNLVRILTHEIMNSITPISSMTASLLDTITEDENKTRDSLNPDELDDIADALQTIHRRSKGLVKFVGTYRDMTLIPKPKIRILLIKEFFTRIERLMNQKLSDNNIILDWNVEPESLELTADPDLMEQVMINLILNAIYAVTGRGKSRITLSAYLGSEGKVMITVEDNGVGIVKEALEKIFIPFFTTKKKGSGIGLSLSRQILRLHHATINAESKPDEGAKFTLKFS
jgi:two-component system nitrogen regulation sensor histidine kinase NtrY